MKTNSKWIPTTVALVVISLVTTTLQPSAFGKDPENAQSEATLIEKVTEKVGENTPAALPNRPEFMVAQAATSQNQTRAVTPQAIRPPEPPAARQSPSKSKKWILIVAAAGAAGAAAFLIGRGSSPPPPAPTIVVGAPIVGQPQ